MSSELSIHLLGRGSYIPTCSVDVDGDGNDESDDDDVGGGGVKKFHPEILHE